MKILLIEDEEPAAKRLQKMLKEIEPTATILETIVSVSSAIKWLKENEAPDLVISDIKTINIQDVAYFYTEDKINFLTTKEGRRYTIDFNLDTLETMLNPKVYFRINRQYIIGIHAITEMFAYSKSRVLIKLNPPTKQEIVVSTERSGDFKLWLGDEK